MAEPRSQDGMQSIPPEPWLESTLHFVSERLRERPDLAVEVLRSVEATLFPGQRNPVLSAAKPWFSQGFSHFWPIALEFCSAHATRCMAPAALYFASRTENRVVFRVALGRQNTGVLNIPGLAPIHTRGGGRIRTR